MPSGPAEVALMLKIQLRNKTQNTSFAATGVLEIGRTRSRPSSR
jgi:hypothetical protein